MASGHMEGHTVVIFRKREIAKHAEDECLCSEDGKPQKNIFFHQIGNMREGEVVWPRWVEYVTR